MLDVLFLEYNTKKLLKVYQFNIMHSEIGTDTGKKALGVQVFGIDRFGYYTCTEVMWHIKVPDKTILSNLYEIYHML